MTKSGGLEITRVLVLAPPLTKAGGIQRYTTTLIRALTEELGEEGVRCVAISDPLKHNISRTHGLSSRLKLRFGWQAMRVAARWKPDVIICTHLALGLVGWLLASFTRRAYWIVVHGIEAWAMLPFIKGAALRHADRVIVTGAFNREQVVKRQRIDSTRISTLPCALDETLINAEPAKADVTAPTSNGQPIVLSVGRMAASERYKGHDVVLRALPSVLATVPNLTYVVVGTGDDRPRLEKLAKDLNIAGHVAFTGEVSDSELAALYRRSEVFALPARTVIDDHDPKGEGFGIVFLEAMAFGKPVIGPNYGAPAELIRHGETGLMVDPEDPASVAEALLDLLTHPERAREMGNTGGERVRTYYSYARFREQLHLLLSGYSRQSRIMRFPGKFLGLGRGKALLEGLFLLWVIVVNILYYAQFKALLISRLGHFIPRWP
jgi:glycosyltransferase involved in cell wall biosynthesis